MRASDPIPLADADVSAFMTFAHLTGQAFLDRVAVFLRDRLDALAVSIGEVGGSSADRIKTLALAASVEGLDMPSYPLSDTPCRIVVDTEQPYVVRTNAGKAFPLDGVFAAHRVESYVGVPLRNPFGRTFGLVRVLSARPRDDADAALAVLHWFAPRISGEAAFLRMAGNLGRAIGWLSTPAPELYPRIAQYACETEQVSTVVVAEWLDNACYRILALAHDGRLREDLSGRVLPFEPPFTTLRDDGDLELGSGLRTDPNRCDVVRELGVDACAAVCIRDRDGTPIGHFALLSRRPLKDAITHSPGVSLYVAGIGAQLSAERAERRRREAEQALFASQKLESIGLMAGGIAHDFNNLLVSMLGNADLALDQVEPESPAHAGIRRIETAATRAGEMVSRLLDYAGRKSTAQAPIDLSALVRDAVQLVPSSHYPNAAIELALGEHLPFVTVDATQVRQVVVNLLLNAAEALVEGRGRITISTREVRIDPAGARLPSLASDFAACAYVLLEIADTGAGMDDASLARACDPFFTSKPTGRGLGLSMVQGIAKGHGAGLTITSRPGAGTRVHLYVPASHVNAAVHAPRTEAAAPGLDAPVLVVDDEPAVGEVIGQLLRALGYTVIICSTGEDAARRVASRRHGAALIDVRMPGLDGWQTLRQLRALQPDLPIAMVSGFADLGDVTDLADEHRAAYLAKPFRRAALAAALSAAACLTPAQ